MDATDAQRGRRADPLDVTEDRFALGQPGACPAADRDEPPGSGTRPLGMRFLSPGTPVDQTALGGFRFCHQRQVAVSVEDDGRLLMDTVPPTTTGDLDGAKGPSEEWKPDP